MHKQYILIARLELLLTQVASYAWLLINLSYGSNTLVAVIGLNLFLLFLRLIILMAIAPSYQRPAQFSLAYWLFWLSTLSDPLAVLRIFLSSRQTPTQWRGRIY